ncbi:TetR family transcriptional regulator [Nocardioides faecalis]|nr:TetR family transcriptional regulator [Nocardioides faecalis]
MAYGGGVAHISSPERAAPRDADRLRPAGRATRNAIEVAARDLFAAGGFDATSVRAIAARAGVDPALVIRHFGSKEALFLATVDTSLGIDALVEGPLETFGRRLVAYFLDPQRTVLRQRYVAIARAAHLGQVREEIVRHNLEKYVGPLAPRLSGERRELRVALAVAQLGGLLNALFMLEDPTLTAAATDDLVELYGDAIQRLLTP